MDNIKQFPQREKTQEQKYHELLEENRQLRKKIEALQNEANEKNEQRERLTRIQKRLARKSKSMTARAKVMASVDTIEEYKALSNEENFAELFGIIKAVRWQLHSVTTAFNLSVIERRTDEGVSKSFRSFSQNPTYLTILRVCLNKFSNNMPITTGNLILTAQRYGVKKTVVTNFLAQALKENILTQRKKGTYELSDETKDDYWFNLLKMIFKKETIQLVGMLRRVYGMTDMALLQHGSTVGSMRAYDIEKTRKTYESAYNEVIKDVI
tara:strand:- start:919 stop:1722 length:804 start_codon:yes stop_codon:yes gene_type:complete